MEIFSSTTTTTPTGTNVKFNPPTGTRTMMKGDVSTIIHTRHQCITCMKEYEDKSLEELRVEDYAANRKGGATFGFITQQTGGLFGSTAAASTSGFSFNTTQSKPLFGTTGTSFTTTTPTGTACHRKKRKRKKKKKKKKTTTGTAVKFNPPTGIDTKIKGDVSIIIHTRHQCIITGMKEYENKSLEELRVEDYAANRKGGAAGGITFGFITQQTGGLHFCSTAAASTSGFSFGNTTQNEPLFGTTGTTLKKVQRDMKNLFKSGEDCDITLKVQTKNFPAHRNILRARSPVFKSMFSHDMEENRIRVVHIQDSNPSTFSDSLKYLYSGSTMHISEENVCLLYIVSDKYQVEELKQECTDFMIRHLSVESSATSSLWVSSTQKKS